MPQAYIGITDFMNADQVRSMLKVLRENEKMYWQRRLGVGVMTSWKVLHDKPTEWADAFPKKGDIADIFVDEKDVYNVLHYADYAGNPLPENLEKLVEIGGPNLHAIQLDMVWPNAIDVLRFRSRHPHIGIIIQANTKALHAVDNDPEKLVERLRSYGSSIDYVLLDKSAGKGLGMDARSLLPFIRTIVARLPTLAVAAAGGLGPSTYQLADPIIAEFEVSLDAQGRLRPSGSALDPVDWQMAASYLACAAAHFDALIFDNR